MLQKQFKTERVYSTLQFEGRAIVVRKAWQMKHEPVEQILSSQEAQRSECQYSICLLSLFRTELQPTKQYNPELRWLFTSQPNLTNQRTNHKQTYPESPPHFMKMKTADVTQQSYHTTTYFVSWLRVTMIMNHPLKLNCCALGVTEIVES